jgi:surface protein
MFDSSEATSIDLSSFNTSNVINMSGMFRGSKVKKLNLSSFDMGNNPSTSDMLFKCSATEGHARTKSDADILNNIKYKPEGLVFITK